MVKSVSIRPFPDAGHPETQRALGNPESPLLIPIRNTGYARQCMQHHASARVKGLREEISRLL
jgi:hypothetical protein